MADKLQLHTTSGWTTLFNEIGQASHISNAAKGLYWSMRTLPPNWKFSIMGLAAYLKDSHNTIKKQLDELIAVGLIKREQIKDEQNKFSHSIYHIYDKLPKGQVKTYSGIPDNGCEVQECDELETEVVEEATEEATGINFDGSESFSQGGEQALSVKPQVVPVDQNSVNGNLATNKVINKENNKNPIKGLKDCEKSEKNGGADPPGAETEPPKHYYPLSEADRAKAAELNNRAVKPTKQPFMLEKAVYGLLKQGYSWTDIEGGYAHWVSDMTTLPNFDIKKCQHLANYLINSFCHDCPYPGYFAEKEPVNANIDFSDLSNLGRLQIAEPARLTTHKGEISSDLYARAPGSPSEGEVEGESHSANDISQNLETNTAVTSVDSDTSPTAVLDSETNCRVSLSGGLAALESVFEKGNPPPPSLADSSAAIEQTKAREGEANCLNQFKP